MYTPIARLLTRFQGEGDGLIIGAQLKCGQGIMKPNHIYELRQCQLSGQIILECLGPSNISLAETENYKDSPLRLSWAFDLNDILVQSPYIFTTKQELSEVIVKETREREEY